MSQDPVRFISEEDIEKWEPKEDVKGGPGWYFFEETWAYVQGPYKTEAEAREACKGYAATL